MGNSWTLDENPRKLSILFAGCQKLPETYGSFRDLAKFVHWRMQKFPGICGKLMDA